MVAQSAHCSKIATQRSSDVLIQQHGLQQHGSYRGHLRQGIGLAEEAGAELPPCPWPHTEWPPPPGSPHPCRRPAPSPVTGISAMCVSTRKSVLSSSLSATGSRYWPSMVRCFSRRASRPSSASVSPAATKRPKPSAKWLSRMAATRNGARQMRNSVSRLGAVRNRLQSFA